LVTAAAAEEGRPTRPCPDVDGLSAVGRPVPVWAARHWSKDVAVVRCAAAAVVVADEGRRKESCEADTGVCINRRWYGGRCGDSGSNPPSLSSRAAYADAAAVSVDTASPADVVVAAGVGAT